MTVADQGTSGDWADLYDGFDSMFVGPGTLQPNIYATDQYARKKRDTLLIGGLADTLYAGFFVDQNPLCLSMFHEAQYNTVLSFNLHYVPQTIRLAMINVVFETNQQRIRNNQPLIIDYHLMKRRVPESQFIVRRYKLPLLRVLGNIPLSDWTTAVSRVSGKENVYRTQQQ